MTPAGVRRHTLDNGLRIVHCEDKSTPNIALDVIYDVGSKDESPELTGIAHLFEHLMFGGSRNVPFFDRELEYAGGWSNAWTSADFTNFYEVLPAVNAETAFWLESDRMKALLFSEEALETQRSVVIEEFKQTCLNQPYGDISHHLLPLLYSVHPYSTPVIGKDISHIEKVTNEDIRRFFYSHYGPDNAVLAVTGNISFETTVELAEKWFGDIKPIRIPPRRLPQEPEIPQPRRLTVYRDVPYPRLVIAFHMAGRSDLSSLEYEAADTITDILALGRASRFYQNLVRPGFFSICDASIFGSQGTGYMIITAQFEENSDSAVENAEKLIWEQLNLLKDSDVTADELKKAVNKLVTRIETGKIGFLSKVQSLAVNTLTGIDDELAIERYNMLTPDIITVNARKILRQDHGVTLVYRPKNATI